MVAPAWCRKYMKARYQDKGRGPNGFDCWGFVRWVEKEEFGICDLPDLSKEYSGAENHTSVCATVEKYSEVLAGQWHEVQSPLPGDIVIVKIGGRPWHCAVAVGSGYMMHILKGSDVSLEKYSHPDWRNRIGGFYRHV